MKLPAKHNPSPEAWLWGVHHYILELNSLSEEDTLSELNECGTDTLLWIMNDIAIPSREYHIVWLVQDILKTRISSTA